jgi:CHAT domain-containing protein
VSGRDLAEQLLSIPNEDSRRVFLGNQREELGLECFEKLKTCSDSLLLEQPGRALEIAEVALQAASFASTPLAKAVAWWARGNALVHLGQYERALRDYSKACAIQSERGEDELAVARLQTNMVGVLKNLGRYKEALDLADGARDALRPWGQSRYLATLEMNVGSTCRLMGRYEDALAAYERGEAIFASLGDQVQTARMQINRARTLVCMDRFRESEALLRTAGSALAKEGKVLPAARVDLNLATLLSRQGRHRLALETYSRARTTFAMLSVETDVAVTDLYRTYDYLALNLVPEARDLANETQNIMSQLELPRYIALAASNRAVAARKLGRYTEALDVLLSARSIFAERGATVEAALLDVERAICLREMGDPWAAATMATGATKLLADHNLTLQAARARLTLADCLLASGETDDAAGLYLLAQEALREMPPLVWQAHDGLGQVAEAHEKVEEAYHHYREAIACIESAEGELGSEEFRAGFLDDKLKVYQRAVRLALALGDEGAAFQQVQQSKIGVWRDVLAQRGTKNGKQVRLQALRQEWHWLYNRMTRPDENDEALLDVETEEVRLAKLGALERQLVQARRESSPVLQRQPGPSLSTVQQHVPADTLLLDYYCTDEEVIVFIVSAEDVRILKHIAPLDAVGRAINHWRLNVDSVHFSILDGQPFPATRLSEEARSVLHSVYQLLIEPLEPYLAGYRSLWVSPHGLLWTLPFAALCDGQRYLVEKFDLTYLPGLVSQDQHIQDRMSVLSDAPLIVGYSEEGRLPHVVSEAQTVAATLGGGELLLEDKATAKRFRIAASSSTLLHLATHGFFRSDAPVFSALHLADGWLTAGDLEEWYLPHVGLVTLSACETGKSLNWGSDLLGLARGFFRAGARQLVVSLWAVEDVSTSELMAHFYGALRAGEKATVALQKAQLAVLDEYQHPFYWAGFVVMGLL